MKRKVFVSFDYDNDHHYKYLLNAWNGNPEFEFSFDDRTPSEIQTDSVDVVKRVLTRKISEANYVLVIVGKEANKPHKDRVQIGYKNWQNYEIAKAKELQKKIVAVFIESWYSEPDELFLSFAKKVYGFSQDGILNALRRI